MPKSIILSMISSKFPWLKIEAKENNTILIKGHKNSFLCSFKDRIVDVISLCERA